MGASSGDWSQEYHSRSYSLASGSCRRARSDPEQSFHHGNSGIGCWARRLAAAPSSALGQCCCGRACKSATNTSGPKAVPCRFRSAVHGNTGKEAKRLPTMAPVRRGPYYAIPTHPQKTTALAGRLHSAVEPHMQSKTSLLLPPALLPFSVVLKHLHTAVVGIHDVHAIVVVNKHARR